MGILVAYGFPGVSTCFCPLLCPIRAIYLICTYNMYVRTISSIKQNMPFQRASFELPSMKKTYIHAYVGRTPGLLVPECIS